MITYIILLALVITFIAYKIGWWDGFYKGWDEPRHPDKGDVK
jgi:hypothetical protein